MADRPRLALLRRDGSWFVDYAETLAHPERIAQRLDRFLDAQLDVNRAAAAADPDLYRNRRTATGA